MRFKETFTILLEKTEDIIKPIVGYMDKNGHHNNKCPKCNSVSRCRCMKSHPQTNDICYWCKFEELNPGHKRP